MSCIDYGNAQIILFGVHGLRMSKYERNEGDIRIADGEFENR